jgi:hypothetical protein
MLGNDCGPQGAFRTGDTGMTIKRLIAEAALLYSGCALLVLAWVALP